MGIDKKGFENAPQAVPAPIPNFDAIILKTSARSENRLHSLPRGGQRSAVNSIEDGRMDWPSTGTIRYCRRTKCSRAVSVATIDVGSLRNKDGDQIAINWANGERDFRQLRMPLPMSPRRGLR